MQAQLPQTLSRDFLYIFLFLVQNISPSLYSSEEGKSHFIDNSSKVYLLFFSESAAYKIVLYYEGLV